MEEGKVLARASIDDVFNVADVAYTHSHTHTEIVTKHRGLPRALALLSLSKRGELKPKQQQQRKHQLAPARANFSKAKPTRRVVASHTHTLTHNETHTNRHDAHATSLTRDAAKRVMGYIVGRIGKAKSSERKSKRERAEGQNKTHFCCRLALCPQQQPLQIQLKAMHEIQMRRRAATLRFGCRAECTRSQSARTRARTRGSCFSYSPRNCWQRHNFVSIRRALTLLLSLARALLLAWPAPEWAVCV